MYKNKIFAFLLLGVFMLSLTSAAEFDNAISDYNETTETITFRNGCLFEQGWTCVGSEIGKVKLITPRNYHVTPGYNYVWEIEAEVYEDYNDFIKQLEYLDLKTKVKINRNLDIKVFNGYEDYEDPTYSCSEWDVEDGESVCTATEENGTITKTREVWNKVTPADLKNGKTRLRGYTEIGLEDYIDWSPVIFGVRVDHDIWASWTTDMNIDLSYYITFNETSGNLKERTGALADGVASNLGYSQTGIPNGNFSVDFNGVSSDVQFADDADADITGNFTFNTWIKMGTETDTMRILSKGGNAGNYDFAVVENTQTLRFSSNSVATTSSSVGEFGDNTWHMVTMTLDIDVNNMTFYLDGIQVDDASYTTTPSADTEDLCVSRRCVLGPNYFDGELDELTIWGRVLTPEEINETLYNQGDGNTYSPGTTGNAPSVTLITPIDNANLTSTSVTFNTTVTDALQVDNVTLYIDGVLNETNSSGFNGTYIFSKTISDGDHNWSILAWNNQSLSNQSETRDFNVNMTGPDITINSPLNITYNVSEILFSIEATDDAGIDSCWFNIGGDNISLVEGGDNNNTNFQGPGTMASDSVIGTRAWDSPDNAKIDDLLYSQSSLFSGSGADTEYLKATNLNFSIPVGSTIDGILVESLSKASFQTSVDYVIDNEIHIVKANGSLGTENKADTVTKYPASDTYRSFGSSSDVWGENWTAEDINDADFGIAMSLEFIRDSEFNVAAVNYIRIKVYYTENNLYTYTNSSVPDGTYTTNYYCNNTLSVNATESVVFSVDTIFPQIQITGPQNTSYNTIQTQLNYTLIETNQDTCWYSLDGGTTNVTIASCLNVTGLSSNQGSNTWTVYSNDTAGNENSSTVTFFVDSINPNVTINSPITQTYITSEILFSINATDDTGIDSCWFNLDDGDNISLVNVSDTYTYTNSSVPDGTYTTNYFCNDTLNNVNNTESVVFSIDTTVPVIDVESPNGTLTFNTVGDNETLNVTFTDTTLDSCWYNYNGTNVSIEGCVSGVKNSTQFILEEDNFNMTIYANDSFGSTNSEFIEWEYLFGNWDISYTTPQYESTEGTFTLNTSLSNGGTIEEGIFRYNGTNYTTSIITSGGLYLITSSITLPSVDNDTNFTFNFFVVVDGVTYSFSEDTQEVLNIEFITCVGVEDLLINISLFDEEFRTTLFGDIELNIQVYSKTSDDVVSELNGTYENISSQEICLSPSASFPNFYLDAEIRYVSDGYAAEFYYIQDADMDDYPINLSLFDLNLNDSTEFSVTYKNNAFIFEEGAVIQLQRKYIGEDTYEVVEAPLTGDGGKAVLHIDLNSNKYRASVVKDGELLDFFDNIVFSCENELSGDCTYSFDGTVDPNNDVPIESITDFSYSVSIDENNQTVTVLFAIPSGTPGSINVLLEQTDMFRNSTSCNTTVITSAGSITCDYTDTIEKSILELSISKNGVQLAISSYVNDPDLDMDGMNFFIAFLFMISLVGMAIASPEWMIIISVMTLIISGTLLLLKGMSLVIGLGAIGWVVVAAAIIIFKMAKQEDR